MSRRRKKLLEEQTRQRGREFQRQRARTWGAIPVVVQTERYFAVVALDPLTGTPSYQSYNIVTGAWSGWIAFGGRFSYIVGVDIVGNILYVIGLSANADVVWFNSVNLDTGVFGGWVNLGATYITFQDYQVQVGAAWVAPLGTQWDGRLVVCYNSTLGQYRLYCGANVGWHYVALT